ncbi:MAG: hypothetical protein E6K69_04110 [Nitrospirae bacterium]|nr:MAG: hypothetical protein E6K69_04110 [Nitrospirota bacterium]
MRRWVSVALLIALPCFLALLAYDWVAVVVLGYRAYRLVPWHDLARGMLQDLGLTAVYAVTVTPRVAKVVADFPEKARHLCLIMLGLGLAWYDVMCAWVTRLLDQPPDLGIGTVVLFVIPIVLAPSYVRWLKTKVPEA